MKTPEQYISEHEPFIQYEGCESMFTEVQMKAALISMQEDHEKELKEAFKAGRDSVTTVTKYDPSNFPVTFLQIKYTYTDWLTQFRNKQDR